ncbi:MAG: hypothetical protein KF835_13360 [Xanthobacteraceae bacterium]|nr:hypothetical protein [Xanthobacteraceae bacterium]
MRPYRKLDSNEISRADFLAAALLCFCLYFGSAVVLDARGATTHFGADSYLYQEMVHGSVQERIVRFHPLIVGAALAWMKLFGWLGGWIEPALILKALFAAVGAGGVVAAVAAFSAFVPRREALLCGGIYAVCLGIWYFASIEESKIVTATLSSIYVAIYLRLRESPGNASSAILIAVFFAACLNEITACFLAIIPAADSLIRHGWRWWPHARPFKHLIAGFAALAILEFFGRVAFPGQDGEGASHASMFLHYFFKSDHGLAILYSFLCNWLAFNLVAPGSATHFADPALQTAGYFGPGIGQYLSRPAALLAILSLGSMLVFGSIKGRVAGLAGILFALAAYSAVRGAFFFVFNPEEPLLFSPAVALAHVMIVLVPFVKTGVRWRGLALASTAAAMVFANGGFLVGF